MKKLIFKSIKSKLTFWFLVVGIFTFTITSTIAYLKLVNTSKIRAINKITAIRDLKTADLNDWFLEAKRDLYILSNSFELRELETVFENKTSSNKGVNLKKIATELLTINNKAYDKYSELYIINKTTGLIEISTNPTKINKDESTKNYYLTTLKEAKLVAEDIHKDTPLDKNHFGISIPIFGRAHPNRIIGVLHAEINLKTFVSKIMENNIGLGKTGESVIINTHNFVLNKLRWHKDAPLNLKITAEPALKAIAGKTGVIETKDYRGVKVLAAYTYIPQMKWGFICKQDMKEINSPIRNITLQFISLFVIYTFFISLIVFVISNSISKPIVLLKETAEKIAKGKYTTIKEIKGMDEIGSLSKSIINMSHSIQSKNLIQQGVTNISNTMIEQSSLHQFSTNLLKQLKLTIKADQLAFYVLNELNSTFETFTVLGFQKDFLKPISLENNNYEFTEKILTETIINTQDYPQDILFNATYLESIIFPKNIITVPIKVEDIIVAIILIATNSHFSEESIAIITQSSNNINTSYTSLLSNLRVGILAENVLKIYDELEEKTNILTNQNIDLLKQKLLSTEANKELEAFSYSVSHDLRAPLRHIDGFTKLLNRKIKDKIDEKSQSYFDNIISSTNQMNTLIEDLLVFSRTGRKGVKKSKIKMNKIVEEAIKIFDTELKEKSTTINVEELGIANVDPSLFLQVWINLISNAIKFTSKTQKPTIKIGIKKDAEETVIYYIKDNGVGFEQKYVEKLFGVFQRLHSNAEFPGTGIGLANVKRIINKHGGEIWAEGEINKGASFFFKLKKQIKLLS